MSQKEQTNYLDDPAYYAYRCREVTAFIFRHSPQLLTLEETQERWTNTEKGSLDQLYAVLQPKIIKVVEYRPLRQVTRIKVPTEKYRHELVKYWEGKYKIKLAAYGEWKWYVGLKFGQREYDFPSNIIGAYLEVDETDQQKTHSSDYAQNENN
jgi:hypothetical protein